MKKTLVILVALACSLLLRAQDVSLALLYNLDVEPWEPNITTLVDFDSKWADLLVPGTPIPTPNTYQYNNIDVFAGQDNCQAEIIDLTGKTVLSVRLEKEVNRIVIRDLPQGVYLLRANGESRKFVKQ